MDLLHQGVVQGEISLTRWVDVCSTTPSKIFGLQGTKGVIAAGADADIVVYDPQVTHRLGVDQHHMNIDNSVWEGMEVTGQARSVMSRGSWVVRDRNYLGRPGHGRFLKRSTGSALR